MCCAVESVIVSNGRVVPTASFDPMLFPNGWGEIQRNSDVPVKKV